jgi:hypothetical protein
VALDPNGNAVAVWSQRDGERIKIWANRFTSGAGWGAAERIEGDDTDGSFEPQVAFDPNGNAVAVWPRLDGTRADIWANRFSPTAGWDAAERIESDAGNGFAPDVALDPNGDAVAVWSQRDGVSDSIWANRFTRSAGWGAAERIQSDDAGSAFAPDVALDPNGNAVAVWYESAVRSYDIWANRFE